MKVKKFIASNNQEALAKVRAELGPDAVILHQRRVKPKGIFGGLKKHVIEVVAAIEDSDISKIEPIRPANFHRTPEFKYPTSLGKDIKKDEDFNSNTIRPAELLGKPNYDRRDILNTRNTRTSSTITEMPRQNATITPDEIMKIKMDVKNNKDQSDMVIAKEIGEIKNMLKTVIKKVNQEQLPAVIKNLDNEDIQRLYNSLKEQEIEDEIIEQILHDCVSSMNKGLPLVTTKEMIESRFKKIVHQYVDKDINKVTSKIMFFVGPTGVGKTTTIAKLAAHYSLNEGKSIGLVSADTYRIAAVEQLKTYSDILNIPLEVIYSPMEIHQAVQKLSHKDIIMVDTAGRSHKNEKQMSELQRLITEVKDKEVYLVVSCTTKNIDMKEIVETYNFLDDYKIIFTKVDEAVTFGTILNTALQTQKPVSYITTGQNVPDDIEPISVDKIISLLMKEAY